MTKKPKVFENEFDKPIKNNKIVFDSTKEDEKEEYLENNNSVGNIDVSNETVVDKITQLMNRNGYIFNVLVTIVTRDGEFKTHIASVINNHVITLDNDIINISDIIDIKY